MDDFVIPELIRRGDWTADFVRDGVDRALARGQTPYLTRWFTGLAAAATGFVLHNNVLIVSGMLVGASGTLLTILMGRAMNRSLGNVLFGAFGKVQAGAGAMAVEGTVRSATAQEVAKR